MSKKAKGPKGSETEVDQPIIELYMTSLQQEFPVDTEVVNYREWKEGGETITSWGVQGKLTDEEKAQNVIPPWKNNWQSQWQNKWHMEWIQNKPSPTPTPTPTPPAKKEDHWRHGKQSPAHLQWREEDFGGIVLDPAVGRVFKVNKAGLKLIQEIVEFSSSVNSLTGKFKSTHFSVAAIEPFLTFLREAGYVI